VGFLLLLGGLPQLGRLLLTRLAMGILDIISGVTSPEID